MFGRDEVATSKAVDQPALPTRRIRASWIAIGVIVGIAILPGLLNGGYTSSSITDTLTNVGFYISISIIFAILALGFNLQWGYTGLFNAGIAGFYLIGAYTMAIAVTPPSPAIIIGGVPVYPGHFGGFSLPFVAGVLLATIVSGLVAALVALPALRLRADYLAIATLAFAEILQVFATNLQSLTGGSIGIILIPKPIVFTPASTFLNTMSIIGIGAGIVVGLLALILFITESPWGRVLRAVRDDEEAAMALGKNTSRYKLQSFAIGGALMGLAGALFAVTLGYVEPSTNFAPAVTFSVWVMVIVGGAGNYRGVLVGAFLIYGMEWLSVQLKSYAPAFLQDSIFYIRLMIVGMLLIILIIYRPEGILREAKRVLR
jgi:branched-chain amino acid transport system permease protein